MLRRHFPFEFVYQVFALIGAAILVHALYLGLVRPQAQTILAEQAGLLAIDPAYVPERSFWVVIKDYEQEVCFILLIWGTAIIAYKAVGTLRERRLLDASLLNLTEGESVLPEDTRTHARALETLPESDRERLLPRALLAALQRFRSTHNIQDVSDAVAQVCETENDRLDSEMSMVRYIAWAIPSIGFIGTVRGIGDALSQAHRAVEGDIAGVTESLGVAFNSTFIALVISIVLMFLVHQLQLVQERLVLDTRTQCDRRLLSHLQVRE